MSKLIGTNPNQVPSNADLGTAAFTDSNDYISALSKINSNIAATAVDVFVYDTRKDSDGGAWRKRTQHTSWYNERLNTATRGNRREFPAVAVIVATTSSVTIYDGDDALLPMWMVFTINNSYWLKHSSGTGASCVSMLNATLVTGGAGAVGRLSVVEFIADRGHVSEPGYNYKHNNISRRNIDPVGGATGSIFIANISVNDVAMTVLPNAPIDPATGLPIPTIAVATNNGVSVIRDSGQVYDINYNAANSYNFWSTVKFTSDYKLIIDGNFQGFTNNIIHVVDIPNADFTGNTVNARIAVLNGRYYHSDSSKPNISLAGTFAPSIAPMQKDRFALGGDNASYGLDIIDEAPDTVSGITSDAMVAYIKSDYNTGWMPGDIRLATLADTTQGTTGPELITNGTFSSNVTGWSTSNGSTIVWNGSGDQTATVTSGGLNIWNGATQTLTGLVVGKTYILTADIITSNNWGSISFSAGANSGVKYGTYTSWNSGSAFPMKAVAQFTASTTSVVVSIDSLNTTNTTVTKIDNISVHMSEEDRCVKGKDLQVYGTLNKTPVATGADLVAYSGFSSSNYLGQPYNSDLDFGTGDISAMGWFKLEYTYVGTKIFFDRADPSWPSAGSGQRTFFGLNGNDYLYYYTDNGNATTSTAVPSNVWIHACFVRSGTSHQLYMNGKHVLTNIHTASSLSGSGNVLTVGNGSPSKANPWPGQLALWRLSATAPSPEQIAKIYNDEKYLFQENAKATLYGTSDAVTALAYDDSTNLLHAGTSAGRSIFQGLRRIDNTTTAVGTAISASNGMVAEE